MADSISGGLAGKARTTADDRSAATERDEAGHRDSAGQDRASQDRASQDGSVREVAPGEFSDQEPPQAEGLFSAETLTVSKILFFGPDDEENPVPAIPAAPDPIARPAAHYRPAAGGHPDPAPEAPAAASDGSNADTVVETKPSRKAATRPRKQAAASIDGAAAENDAAAALGQAPAARARRTPTKKATAPAPAATTSAATSQPADASGTEPRAAAAPVAGEPAKPARKPRTKKVAAATATAERAEVRASVTVPAEAVSTAAQAADGPTSTEVVPMTQEIQPGNDSPAPAEAAPPAAPVKRTPRKATADAAPARKRPAKTVPAQQATAAPETAPADAAGIEPVPPTVVDEPPLEGTIVPAAEESAEAAGSPMFAVLAAEPFISLTTFRKSGTPVPTPVWAAPDGNTLLVWTGAESGKVKRLAHTPGITVAPCDRQGRLLGDPVPATARVLPPEELPRVKAAMTEKYGWQFRLSALGATLGRFLRIAPHGQTALEILLEEKAR